MPVEQARALLAKVQQDDEFRHRLEEAPPGERRAVIEEAGFGDVKLRDIAAILPESAGGDLSEEELENVAGGFLFDYTSASGDPATAAMTAMTGLIG